MAAAGVPLRTLRSGRASRLQRTTLIYADYQLNAQERALVQRGFAWD